MIKADVAVCDLCKAEEIYHDIDTFGLYVTKAHVFGPQGGGPLPEKLFVCWHCVYEADATLAQLVALMWQERDQT